MRTETITCDGCGADLTDGGPMPAFTLSLGCTRRHSASDFVYDVLVYPPIKRTHHFCDLACLDTWRAAQAAK